MRAGKAAYALACGLLLTVGTSICLARSVAAQPQQARDVAAPADEAKCQAALTLAKAGRFDDATKLLMGVINNDPGLTCVNEAFTTVREGEIKADCAEGEQLKRGGDADGAKKEYEAAIAVAQPGLSDSCATSGLSSVNDMTSSVGPGWWRGPSATLLRYATGLALAMGILLIGAFVLIVLLGWLVRGGNRLRAGRNPDWVPIIRLVPRVKLAALAGPSDAPTDALTPLLRGQMQSVQTSDDLHLDFVTTDAKVQGLVTAVKDLDARAGAVGEILMALNFLWPWPTLVIQGQVLPAGAEGQGLSLSIGVDARQPSAIQFWRYPGAGAPTATTESPAQLYYDLVPAAATWSVYEATRLGGTADRGLSEGGAVCHGYLAAGYAVLATGGPDADADRFYQAAVRADPDSVAARLAVVLSEATSEVYGTTIEDMWVLLQDGWVADWPARTDKIWEV